MESSETRWTVTLWKTNISYLREKENNLQKYLGRGYVTSLEGISIDFQGFELTASQVKKQVKVTLFQTLPHQTTTWPELHQVPFPTMWKVAKSLTSFQLFIYNVDFQVQDSNLSIHLSTPKPPPSTSTGFLFPPTFEAAESSQNPGMHQQGHHKGPRERWIESTSTQLPTSKVLWGHQTAASSGWVFFPI